MERVRFFSPDFQRRIHRVKEPLYKIRQQMGADEYLYPDVLADTIDSTAVTLRSVADHIGQVTRAYERFDLDKSERKRFSRTGGEVLAQQLLLHNKAHPLFPEPAVLIALERLAKPTILEMNETVVFPRLSEHESLIDYAARTAVLISRYNLAEVDEKDSFDYQVINMVRRGKASERALAHLPTFHILPDSETIAGIRDEIRRSRILES